MIRKIAGMAAPKRNAMLRPEVADQIRARIQTSQLINRLTNYALDGKDPKTKKPIEMSTAQVAAALGVLRKSLPDLSATEHSGSIATDPLGELYGRVADKSRDMVNKPNGGNGSSVH